MSGIDPNKIKDAQKLGEMNSRGLNTKETEKRGVLAEQGESVCNDSLLNVFSQEQDISHQPSAENNTEVPTGEFAEGKSEKSLLEELITSETEKGATAEKTEEHKPNEVDTENIEANNIKEQASGSELLTVDKTLCDDVITCVELCQSCLRDDEEEAADLWCNDCSEAVCRSCGKAHRRFAVAHDVISIKDATACRKHLPKSCSKHEIKKIILFCVGHDKLICHECLSESHRSCDKILEIEKAADGIKNSAAITDLKERMRNFASILEKTQTENKQTISKVSKEKESAYDHIQELFQCFKNHLLTIQNNLNKNYEKIVKQNEENSEQLKYLRQNLQENIDWMCMLERSSSERNIFHAVKHLDAIQIVSEKQIVEIKKDMTTYPLDVLPSESMRNIDKLFEELMGKSKRLSLPKQTAILASDCLKSQIKVEREIPPQMEKLYRPPPYQDLIAGDNSTFGALCFTEDGRIIVEELKDFPREKRY
ncbi:uncharacterized protein LOC127738599 isoform X1 [Mytilus californianus]|uniref:uncharacterized protein LOC127738599 isoform X1 n=1 Tax=Mytilus californianus TaxID=6549 RepID=UPI002248245F|nr:uncharacterized protein LOC127738599 isoform X1 [Mytilus californianus]XP_052105881.1 uncharacterized protein LOC127738599 isoform X1 [Mytilus californianus]XP_052105882.1 uncharacterized protein LOC127738599 isoform X1 [Mytilus californianus]XP_052105883.1 uncharacterized protein LOC127738599 isoform X1 [Mytilus californianus]XP_052105884.1 uncharacterized protein LOC127738599 isoform X1 [Mytilus californianus]XP_052105885.1 uncharacterized protein LOC127738599 isoform X1 [Mytilus californ